MTKTTDGPHPLMNKRVEIPAHLDLWMQGARYGKVVGVAGDIAAIKMDNPNVKRIVRLRVEDLEQYGRIDV